MNRHALRIGASLLLMAVLIAYFLWNVDFELVGEAMRSARPGLIVAAAAIALLNYYLRTIRWQLILRPVGRVRHSGALVAVAVGYAAITLLPARIGDLIRPIVLAKREHLPISGTLASIFTERLFDLWTVIFYFLVFVLFPPTMAQLDAEATRNLRVLSLSGYLFGAGLVVGTLVILGLFRFQDQFVDVVTRPIGRLRASWRGPLANFLNHFLDGLRILQRPRGLLVTMAASLVIWYVIYWQVRVALLAFGIDLPLRAAYFLVTLSVIGLAIPTPGGIGGMHKAIQLGLTAFFAVELNTATAAAIVYHAICFVPITVIGLLCLPLVGLRLRDVDAAAAEEGRKP
ncbi:MAG TPA: lysylphosphatidylglycerol synthase transmembrane domain-containing protein [Thermoanaerobaculales bacterium]|nr:lysylphosphatidylglycerol synthase transmembrane domain-containing protein [Thermoanaerobaculales bacterium]HQL31119.1 lysylphosphatidylglycerol synthase transmembrane domain-containing protein [Thermoanaerobaculales bacterium]